MTDPIIVMGMHRSGTTLVSKILSRCGVFMGNKVNNEREALFFVKLNDWILNQLGGRWDCPPEMDYLYTDREIYKSTLEYLDQCISGPGFVKYLGVKNYVLRSKKGFGSKKLWGWKDPRNVYMLPVWLDVFPNSKVIYIERNGIDVAHSLKTRSLTTKKVNIDRFKENSLMYTLGLKKIEFSSSIKCCNLEEGYALWEKYIKESKKNISRLKKTKVLTLKYENLVLHPKSELKRIINFTGGSAGEEVKKNLVDDMNKERAYAYKNNPELVFFAANVGN